MQGISSSQRSLENILMCRYIRPKSKLEDFQEEPLHSMWIILPPLQPQESKIGSCGCKMIRWRFENTLSMPVSHHLTEQQFSSSSPGALNSISQHPSMLDDGFQATKLYLLYIQTIVCYLLLLFFS